MAETSTFVIQYLADISNVKKQIRDLEKLNTSAGTNLGKDFSKAIDIVDRRIKSIRSKPVFDKNLGRDVIKTFAEVETVFKGTDGKLKTMTQSTVLADGKLNTLNTTVKNNAVSARGFGANLATLTKRALITIPVWFALRNAIFGVFRTIRDGLKSIAEFDRALQKLRRNLSASSSNVDADFSKAQSTIEQFSLKSGKSVDQVTNAIQKFATVGFGFETSLEGGLRATQLAVTLFGDAEETANAFARSLRVLTEDIKDPAEQQKKIAEALALTDQLWQTNAFEINEFSGNLEKFAGTAKIANLSIEDTLKLLATLSTGGLGNRAGRLLRTTILKALANIENITKSLNLDFDPNKQPTIVFIQELVTALKELRTTENVPVELSQVLGDLFSVRSTEALGALTALEETLKKNIALTPDIAKFDQTFEGILNTTGSLAEQFANVNKQLGRAFVTGLVGGDDFEKSLKSLVDFLRESVDEVKFLGQVLRDTGKNLAEVAGLFEVIVGFASFGTSIAVKEMIKLSFETKKAQEALEKAGEASKEFSTQLGKALSGKLNTNELERVIAGIQTRLKISTIDPEFDRTTLTKALEVLDKMKKVREDTLEVQKQQTQQDEKAKLTQEKREKLAEAILQNELDILRARGARDSQISTAEGFLRKQLDIEKSVLDQLTDQLRKEREINEERRLRSELGSDTIKLFRIAQEQGTQVASQIGDVLAGNTDFSGFIRRGGQAVDIFKKQFADIFEQQQALAFFKGDTVPGAQGLRGGSRIAIEEQALRARTPRFNANAQIDFNKLNNKLLQPTKSTQTNIDAQKVVINSPRPIDIVRSEFNQGGIIRGQEAQALVQDSANRAQASRQFVQLSIDIDGKNFNFEGQVGALREVARQMTTDPSVLLAIENQIVNALDNPQSKISKGIDSKIEKF